jgi:hypothetical protein
VFQARSVDLDMTKLANLRFHCRLFGLWGKLLSRRIDEVVRFLAIADLLDRLVRTLSGVGPALSVLEPNDATSRTPLCRSGKAVAW